MQYKIPVLQCWVSKTYEIFSRFLKIYEEKKKGWIDEF